MALIKCTECGKEFSDKASACPNCGCPIDKMEVADSAPIEKNEESLVSNDNTEEAQINTKKEVDANEASASSQDNKKKKVVIIGMIAAVIVICAIAFFVTADSRKYAAAEKDFGEKKFELALEKYNSLGDYKDSVTKAKECEYELTVDGQFMRALSEGLMARWDKSDENVANGTGYEDPDEYAEYCNIELEKVSKFANEKFSDKQLGEDAKTYIELLEQAKDATKYYTIDYNTYSTQWGEVYAQRTMLLQKFISDYNLAVDDAHQKTLDDMMVDASAAADKTETKKAIHDMADGFTLNETKNEYGYRSYKIQMKNTTNCTFDYFSVEISVLDESGKIVDTGNTSQLTNWVPGQEAEVDAYLRTQSDIDESGIEGKTIQFTPRYSTGTLYE